MKKFSLFLGLFSLVLVGRSQVVLNEIYTDPGSGKSEFFELYNTSTNPVAENLDCYTLVTWYQIGSTTGFYVIDLPTQSVGPKAWYVGAAADPFDVQAQTNVDADFSWNNMPAGGAIYNWVSNGSGYDAGTIPANFNDLFHTNTGPVPTYAVFLFKDGVYINGFMGGENSSTVPAVITGMPTLPIDMLGSCNDFNINWASITLAENTTAAGGSDNGYIRTRDGRCGDWKKSSSQVQHTPRASNGSTTGVTGSLVTGQIFLGCASSPGEKVIVQYTITGFEGEATEENSFPVEVQLYYDYAPLNSFGPEDIYQRSHSQLTLAEPADTFQVYPQNQSVILVYKTVLGCFDKAAPVANTCAPLPVSISMFKANRVNTNVNLVWQTTYELDNRGFYIERNVNGNWEQVGFVASQGLNGTSNDLLNYSFVDFNNVRGITQYRLRQVDIDGRIKLSEIRSVRGEGQPVKLTVYPNPSVDGRIQVAFDDANAVRNVSVLDMSGRVVRQYNGITNNNITIENLNPGMYTVRVVVPETGAQGVEKVIVNKR